MDTHPAYGGVFLFVHCAFPSNYCRHISCRVFFFVAISKIISIFANYFAVFFNTFIYIILN